MKRNFVTYCSLLVLLLVFAGLTKAIAQPEISGSQADKLTEKTILITDREIYAVNEDIQLSAFSSSSSSLRNADWSRVLYVELVSPNGESFARRKLNYGLDGASGKLRIPANLLTGNYYLRAYTRWMRDYSPYFYFTKPLTVINPFRSELLESGENSNIVRAEKQDASVDLSGIKIRTDQTEYSARDQVHLEISANQASGMDEKYVVSVIPEGLQSNLNYPVDGNQKSQFLLDYIPETRGLSISGKIINSTDSLPMKYTLVGLTIFKDHPENRNVLTNENGQFFFDLAKLQGEYEIFISVKSSENQSPLILVDNDFSVQKLILPFIPVDLSDKSKEIYQNLVFNSQMHDLYRKKATEKKIVSFSSDSSFYGAPEFVLNFKDFIALPTIKDYFYELVPQVGVRREDKKTVLKVLGTYSELGIYDPLVLVDMVPIFDIDKVLALQPEKIERIEVVTAPYIRGDIVFGGIVSLFSKKGDLAGIDLPEAGRFITYNMLSADENKPVQAQENPRVPDLRNCLYWNADLKLNDSEPVQLDFNTGDNSGDFLIVVKKVSESGEIQVGMAGFKVK